MQLKQGWQKNCSYSYIPITYKCFVMKNYNQKHTEGNEIVWIAWLIVAFACTILYLIWHMFGYI